MSDDDKRPEHDPTVKPFRETTRLERDEPEDETPVPEPSRKIKETSPLDARRRPAGW